MVQRWGELRDAQPVVVDAGALGLVSTGTPGSQRVEDAATGIGVAPLLQRLVSMETQLVSMETQLVTMDVVAVTMDAQVVLVTHVPVPVEVPRAPPLQVAVTMETQLVTMEVV